MNKLKNLGLPAKPSSHGSLSMAIYKEKCVGEHFEKLLNAKKEAANCWFKWAKADEENRTVQELLFKMVEIDHLWIRSYRVYAQQQSLYADIFQEILQGDKAVEEVRKKRDDICAKLHKLNKQIEKMRADSKTSAKKYDDATLEYGKIYSRYEAMQAELIDKGQNNKLFKYNRVREAVKVASEADLTFHERGYEIAQTQRLLLDFFTASTYTSRADDAIYTAKENGQQLLVDLEAKLKLDDNQQSCSVSDELPVRNTQLVMTGDEVAEYLPIPDMDEAEEALGCEAWSTPSGEFNGLNMAPHVAAPQVPERRPLPPAPVPTEDLYVEPEPMPPRGMSHRDSTYRPEPSNPYFASTKSYDNTAAPPVPMRKNLPKTDSKARMSERPPSRKYMDMTMMEGLRGNSVYETYDTSFGPAAEGTGVRHSAYKLLSEATSGPARQGSTKSSTSQSSDQSSGPSRGNSLRSNTSSYKQEEQDEIVYDTVEGDEMFMSLADVQRAQQQQQDAIYEIDD